MRKILFSLVALVAAMSMNAQVMKIYKNGAVVASYAAAQMDSVVYEDAPAITGSAAVKGGGTVNWVQLRADGPKFAEKNIGANSVTEQGNTMTFTDATKTGDEYAWGVNWCTPSKDQMNELLLAATNDGSDKVTCTSTLENGVWCFKFTGKETGYTQNSVFFPVQGSGITLGANYWSSTPPFDGVAYLMCLSSTYGMKESYWSQYPQSYEFLVRPVLAE